MLTLSKMRDAEMLSFGSSRTGCGLAFVVLRYVETEFGPFLFRHRWVREGGDMYVGLLNEPEFF
jgi:hypothetical protein